MYNHQATNQQGGARQAEALPAEGAPEAAVGDVAPPLVVQSPDKPPTPISKVNPRTTEGIELVSDDLTRFLSENIQTSKLFQSTFVPGVLLNGRIV